MRRWLTLRLPVDALIAAPTEALERLARAMDLPVTRREAESEGAYRGRLRHAIQRGRGCRVGWTAVARRKKLSRESLQNKAFANYLHGARRWPLHAVMTACIVSLVDATEAETNRGERP